MPVISGTVSCPKIRTPVIVLFLLAGGEFKEVYRGLECEHSFSGLSPGHLYRIRAAAVSDGGTIVKWPLNCRVGSF